MELPFFGGTTSSGGGGGGDEALRWLAISEKLLTSRDLMGSKSFASRAREANPQLISAYQILAIVDTLMASEKRVNNHLDWYMILQLQPTHDVESITTQYRRLAVLLNPQKNQLPFADQAFRLVVEAYNILSNGSSKRVYDSEVGLFVQASGSGNVNVNPLVTLDLTGQGLFGQSQQQQPQAQEYQFQMTSGGNNVNGSSGMFGLSGELQNVGNVGRQNVSEGMGNAGGYGGSNVWVTREDGMGGGGGGGVNVAFDFNNNNNIGVSTGVGNGGNVAMDEGRVEDVGEDNSGDERVLGEEDGLGGDETVKEVESNFWTACPYCYHMFEYPKVYLDCTLRCQKCRKAFHGVEIVSPPPTVEGEEAYFCCWGYMPLAVSAKDLGSRGGGASNWTPFSPMFTSPPKPANMESGKSYDPPRFYHDDDDVYVELADSSEGSDDDWQASQRKKKP